MWGLPISSLLFWRFWGFENLSNIQTIKQISDSIYFFQPIDTFIYHQLSRWIYKLLELFNALQLSLSLHSAFLGDLCFFLKVIFGQKYDQARRGKSADQAAHTSFRFGFYLSIKLSSHVFCYQPTRPREQADQAALSFSKHEARYLINKYNMLYLSPSGPWSVIGLRLVEVYGLGLAIRGFWCRLCHLPLCHCRHHMCCV